MFFGKDKIKVSDLNDKIKSLDRENKALRDHINSIQQLLDEINSNLTKAKPCIDFDSMRVFSIERHVNNNKPCTIIGFWVNDPVLSSDGEMIVNRDKHKEWYLYCNEERHAELVEEFKQWKQSTRN